MIMSLSGLRLLSQRNWLRTAQRTHRQLMSGGDRCLQQAARHLTSGATSCPWRSLRPATAVRLSTTDRLSSAAQSPSKLAPAGRRWGTAGRRELTSGASSCGQILYTDKHEWVRLQPDDETVRVGISGYAASALGDVVYAALPEPDTEVREGEECGALESVKAASEVFSPVDGMVVEKNQEVEESPELVNKSPEEAGWLFSVRLADRDQLASLMSADSYSKYLTSQKDDLKEE